MDFRIFETESTAFDFPTVITLEDLTVNFFNEKFRKLAPGVAVRDPLAKHVRVSDMDELIREELPSPCVAEIGGKSCMCAFCPLVSGFDVNYSFSACSPDDDGENGDSFRYLMMKVAVLKKCYSSSASARRRKAAAEEDLLERIRGCVKIADAAYGERAFDPVDINGFMNDVFGYYAKLRYSDGRPHIRILTPSASVALSGAACIQLLSLFHFCMKTSFNAFVDVKTRIAGDMFTAEFVFRTTKRFAAKLFDENGRTNAARIYDALGFDGSDMIYCKKLAPESGGQADMVFDGNNVVASLTLPKEPPKPVHAPAPLYGLSELSADLVRVLLRC